MTTAQDLVDFHDSNPLLTTLYSWIPIGVQELTDVLPRCTGTVPKAVEWFRRAVAGSTLSIEIVANADGAGSLAIRDRRGPRVHLVDFRPTAHPLPACRVCGCTNDLGCVGGCVWVGADLCSKCLA